MTISRLAKGHDPQGFYLLRGVPGIGKILALVILYEIHDIRRFPSVQNFTSYSRLVKCVKESAGKHYGYYVTPDRRSAAFLVPSLTSAATARERVAQST